MNTYIRGRNRGAADPAPLTAVVSEKGQVTIPKPLRDSLGLRTGQRLEFSERAGRLEVRKVIEDDPAAAIWGIGRPAEDLEGMTVDEVMDVLRGPVDLP